MRVYKPFLITAFIAILCASESLSIQAQNLVFNPLDEHLKSPSAYFLNDENGGFYSLRTQMGIGYKNATLHVQKWNGLFWINYPKIEVESYAKPEDNRMAMCLHNGQLHIAGTFLKKGLNNGGLLYFDGTKWSTVGGGIWGNYAIANEIDVADMVSFQNQLFVCGIFNSAGGKTVRNFAVYNGSNWNAVRTNNGRVGALLKVSDTLYAGGNFDSVENVKTGNLAAFYSGNWHASASIPSAIIKLGQFKKGVIICSADSVRLLQSGKLSTLSNNWGIHILNIDQIGELGNSIFISGNFEDKNKQVFHLIQWNGVHWKMWFPAAQMEKIEGNKFPLCVTNSSLFFGGSFSKISGTQTDFVVEIQPGSSWLKGIAYLDNNENCVFDLGDKLLPRMLLSLNKGEYYTTTNTNGEYSIPIKTGSTGNIEVFPSKGNSGGCHGNEQNYHQAFSDTQYSFDFPIILSPEAVPTNFDFKAAGGYKARHGYRNQYEIKVDANTSQYPIKVLLQFVNGLLVTKSDLPWTRKADTELEWTVYNDTTISLELLNNPLIIQAGDTILFQCSFQGNNTSEFRSLEQLIVAAFDPNDKQCDKGEIGKKDKTLEYHIRFQNLGNDSAVNVFVVDTISNTLPMQYIQVTDNSHKQKYNLNYKIRGHALVWNFDEIYLPSQNTSGDELSSGFVHFKAGVTDAIKVGDIIQNRAFIYFDYQKPVATNVTETKVTSTIVVGNNTLEIKLWPMPVQDVLNINYEPYLIQKFEIFNAKGQKILGEELAKPASEYQYPISSLAAGVYVIRVNYGTGIVAKKLLVSP